MRYFTSNQTTAADNPLQEKDSSRRRGATAMEYLFVISLILIVALSAIGSFGQSTKNTMQNSSTAIQKATSR